MFLCPFLKSHWRSDSSSLVSTLFCHQNIVSAWTPLTSTRASSGTMRVRGHVLVLRKIVGFCSTPGGSGPCASLALKRWSVAWILIAHSKKHLPAGSLGQALHLALSSQKSLGHALHTSQKKLPRAVHRIDPLTWGVFMTHGLTWWKTNYAALFFSSWLISMTLAPSPSLSSTIFKGTVVTCLICFVCRCPSRIQKCHCLTWRYRRLLVCRSLLVHLYCVSSSDGFVCLICSKRVTNSS